MRRLDQGLIAAMEAESLLLNRIAGRTGGLSLRVRLLIAFLPLITLSVIATGWTTYSIAEAQLFKNARTLLSRTLAQTAAMLDERFSSISDQLFMVENSAPYQRIVSDQYESPSSPHYYDDLIELNKIFSEAARKNPRGIDSIYLRLGNGREFKVMQGQIARRIGVDLDKWAMKSRSGNGPYYWRNLHADEVFDTVEPREVFSFFKEIGGEQSKTKGLFLFNIPRAYIQSAFEFEAFRSRGYLFLLSPDGVAYSDPNRASYDIGAAGLTLLRENEGMKGSFRARNEDGKRLFVVFDTVRANGWTIAAVAPEEELLADAHVVRDFLLIVVAALIVLCGFLTNLFASSMTGPLAVLSERVKRVEQGDLDVSFELRGSKEIAVLAGGLENLLATVRSLLDKVKEDQERMREAELRVVHAQIKPHFLYNTLASIKYLSDLGKSVEAARMTEALGKFYATGLSGGREVITLREEIDHVRNYLTIQQMRYSDSIAFDLSVPDELLDARIVKLTIQPLVENSIYHGLKNKEGGGLVSVRARSVGTGIEIVVADDGAGMVAERLAAVNVQLASQVAIGNDFFGLFNLQRRLSLRYGAPYGLAIDSAEGAGTRVVVLIPFERGELA